MMNSKTHKSPSPAEIAQKKKRDLLRLTGASITCDYFAKKNSLKP